MKRIKVLLGMLCTLVFCIAFTGQVNAMAAEDTAFYNFERNLQGWKADPDTASNVNYGTIKLELDNTQFFAGARSLRVDMSGGTNKSLYRVMFNDSNLVAGQSNYTYTFNFFIPTSSPLTSYMINIGGIASQTINITKKGEWITTKINITSAVSNNKIFINFSNPSNQVLPPSSIYIDSVSNGLPPVLPAEHDLTIYNFENGVHNWEVVVPGTTSWGTGIISTENINVYAGKQSAKVSLSGGNGINSYRISLPKSNLAGKNYTFNYFLPDDSLINSINVVCTIGGGVQVNTQASIVKGRWSSFVLSIPGNYTSVTNFFIDIKMTNITDVPPSVIYFDSVHDGTVIPLPTATPTPTPKPLPENRTGFLTVDVGSGGTVNLNIAGADITSVSGTYGPYLSKTNATFTAHPSEGYTFAYWQAKSGTIIGDTTTFNTFVGSGLYLKAVFKQLPKENMKECTIVFKDINGNVLKTEVVPEGATATPPADPVLLGYVFVKWDKDYTNISSNLVITAVYRKDEITYTLTVTDGKLSTGETTEEYQYDKALTVIADAAPAGKKFSHWEMDSVKVSNNSTYSFFMPKKNTTVTAIFILDSIIVEERPYIALTGTMVDTTNKTISFVASRSIPTGFTLVESGVILLKSDTVPTDLDLNTSDVLVGRIKNNSTNQFYIRKMNVNPGETWYAKAYLIYQDSEDNLFTVYSGMVQETMN